MTIYDIFFLLFSLIYLPYLVIKGKAHKDFIQRFGILPDAFKEIGHKRPVWIHAVSVGEVAAVKNFVEGFSRKFPERKIILSTTTKTGSDVARKILNRDVLKFYFPLDFSFVVRRALNLINPSILIIMETEIWPNLILELSKRKLPVVLINGRISDRSFKGYKKIRFFFGSILKKINLFCMQTARDGERIEILGVPKDSVKITGNMKFDVETGLRPTRSDRLSDLVGRTGLDLGIGESGQLIIAGSTHGGEEEIVLDVYKELTRKFENLKLIIAPRHIDRAETIKKLVEREGFEKTIFVLDTLGELKHLYSLATIVFMGGSLVKRGGHNIVEPAIFGRPIVFGAYMFNFRDMARSFLENDAAIEVKNKKELLEALETLLRDEGKRTVLGRNAKALIDRNRGATERNIREVAPLLT